MCARGVASGTLSPMAKAFCSSYPPRTTSRLAAGWNVGVSGLALGPTRWVVLLAALAACSSDRVPRPDPDDATRQAEPCGPSLPLGPTALEPNEFVWVGACGDVLTTDNHLANGRLWRATDGLVTELPGEADSWWFTEDGHWLFGKSDRTTVVLYEIATDTYDRPLIHF